MDVSVGTLDQKGGTYPAFGPAEWTHCLYLYVGCKFSMLHSMSINTLTTQPEPLYTALCNCRVTEGTDTDRLWLRKCITYRNTLLCTHRSWHADTEGDSYTYSSHARAAEFEQLVRPGWGQMPASGLARSHGDTMGPDQWLQSLGRRWGWVWLTTTATQMIQLTHSQPVSCQMMTVRRCN